MIVRDVLENIFRNFNLQFPKKKEANDAYIHKISLSTSGEKKKRGVEQGEEIRLNEYLDIEILCSEGGVKRHICENIYSVLGILLKHRASIHK